jgi:uncharacterized protein
LTTQRFAHTQSPISSLVALIDSGELSLPDLPSSAKPPRAVPGPLSRAHVYANPPLRSRRSASPGILAVMSTLASLIDAHRQEIGELARRHRGRTIAVFGSVARGDDSEVSDVDFLVEFEDGSSLFDVLHLQEDLRDLLEREVDVVSAGGLTERDDHIRREAVPL